MAGTSGANAATGASGAAGQGGASQPDDEKKGPTWLDGVIKAMKAIQEFIAGVVGSISWAVAALVIVVVLKKRLSDVLRALVDAMRDRSVSFDVGTVVKVQVAERVPEGLDEARPFHSPSPFDIDDDSVPDGSTLLHQIAPQLTFQVSDSVAREWELHGGAPAVKKMRDDRTALSAACDLPGATFDSLRPALVKYAASLEAARFREAPALADLIDRCLAIKSGLAALDVTDAAHGTDNRLVLFVAGVALAQRASEPADWQEPKTLLDRVAWRDDAPFYVPAGSMWTAASYHQLLAELTATKASVDSDEVWQKINQLIERGQRLLRAMEAQPWGTVGVVSPKGYYLREVRKDLGDVASLVADQLSALPKRRALFAIAEEHLEKCAEDIEGEAPTVLDHNNLADLYRQLGDLSRKGDNDIAKANDYDRLAHEQIDKAFTHGRPSDPAVHHTLALLLFSEQRLRDALLALAEYSKDHALRGDDQDREQYVDNQILAAKLAVAQYPAGDVCGLALAAATLEDAAKLVVTARGRFDAGTSATLQARLDELLAFAYLQLPGREERAVDAFKRLLAWPADKRVSADELRARIGYATALARSARLQRRQFSRSAAERLRARASDEIDSVRGLLEKSSADAAGRRLQPGSVGVWLDAVRAMQLLAEERFAGSEGQLAQSLADHETDILSTLGTALGSAASSGQDAEAGNALRRVVVRHALLCARLRVEADPDLSKEDTVAKVKEMLEKARGATALYECQADLELGSLLLTSAHLGKGDPRKDYIASVASFERAVERDAPSLRAETVRALAQAYALRASILRRAKPSARE